MEDDIKKACEVMEKGGIILYPTDTTWGIGCDATNEDAVKRVYEIKKRIDSKALIVLVDKPVKVEFYVREVPEIAWDLIDVADKPLTIVYPNARNLATNVLPMTAASAYALHKRLSPVNCVNVSARLLSQLRPISAANLPLPTSMK